MNAFSNGLPEDYFYGNQNDAIGKTIFGKILSGVGNAVVQAGKQTANIVTGNFSKVASDGKAFTLEMKALGEGKPKDFYTNPEKYAAPAPVPAPTNQPPQDQQMLPGIDNKMLLYGGIAVAAIIIIRNK